MTLGIDIETYSPVPLMKQGLYKYVKHPQFEILMLSYAIDDGPVVTIDLKKEQQIPHEFFAAYNDPAVTKTAWNAQFEITCMNEYEEFDTDVSQWECTMIRASMMGWPMSLDAAAKAMELDDRKSITGKALIKYFSEPCKPTNSNGNRKRNLPQHNPHKWAEYLAYNNQDVVVEQAISKKISFFKLSPREKTFWQLDQKINNVGVMLDVQLVDQAIAINNLTHERLVKEAQEITGLDNPNSVKQLKEWIGDDVESLTKDNIKELLKENYPPNVKRLLNIRQEMAKTSIKKYVAMKQCVASDSRARGLFQFNGGAKTGRWSSRLIQLQNLPRNKMEGEALKLARDMVKAGDVDSIELCFGNVPDIMSQLLRTAFVPPEDHELLVSDFSAIEARVIAWFANEEWRMEVFAGHGKIYEASGAQMFKMPIEKVVKEIRSKAKVAELALGYQGGVNAMIKMGAIEMGLKEDELQPIVNLWRAANKKIVKLWNDVEAHAVAAISNPGNVFKLPHLNFICRHHTLFIQLPSGRFLSYVKPYLKEGKFANKPGIGFYGVDQITKKWWKQTTYGGKLVENIVQGTARDVLADTMVRLDAAGFPIVMHVHDEVVSEILIAEKAKMSKWAGEIMGSNIPWADGLPLAVESFTTPYYIK